MGIITAARSLRSEPLAQSLRSQTFYRISQGRPDRLATHGQQSNGEDDDRGTRKYPHG